MPIFNNCNGFQIQDGTFYEVSGDVNLHTHPQLTIGDQTATGFQMVPSSTRSASVADVQNDGTEASRRGSGVVRTHRRIVAPVPYDASSRPRLLPRGSSDFQGHSVPSASTSSALIPTSELSRLDPFDPWPNPRYPIHFQYSNFSVQPRQDARVPFPPDDYSLPNIEPSPPAPDCGVNPFVNRPYSFNYQELRNISGEHDHQNFPPTPAIHYALPDLQPAPNNIPAYGGNALTAYSNHLEADPAPSIHNGTFINAQNVHHNYRQGETGINILHRAVALEALHDSADSFPQPKCHPETRKKMLDDLWEYATNPQPPDQILWLYGPAGAGKSAIMWSLCERLQAAGQLGGAFFFKRGHPTRGNAKALFSTIAYRLALRIPSLKGSILQVVENDPSLVAATPETQLQRLVLEPCKSLTNHDAPIIIIDGLDECEGHQMQQEILRILRNSFPQYRTCVRILIASRPEAHIGDLTWGAYRAVNVEQSFKDVQKYLTDEFARIHHDHPRTMANIPRPWPSEEVVRTLVTKSSGHFIYASTIIKFIDDTNFRPTERLTSALENSADPDLDSPFGALDQLYTHILDSVPRKRQLLNILRVIFYFSERLSLYQIDQLLDLKPGDTSLTLRGLHSIIKYENDNSNSDPDGWFDIGWEHASFGDFLGNPTRSGKFYVGGLAPCMDLAQRVLKVLAYANDDEQMNRVHWDEPHSHVAWTIRWGWIELIVSEIPPTAELLPLFFFPFANDVAEAKKMIGWFKQIQPVPVDLVQIWEDHIFMQHFSSWYFQDPSNPVLSTWECEEILSKNPGLLHMFSNHLIFSNPEFESELFLSVHLFLDLSWDKIRSIICPLRDIIGEDMEKLGCLYEFIRDKTQQHHWSMEHKDIIYRAIQVLKDVDSGKLHVEFWWETRPCWGLLIRLHSPCPDLLREIREFVPSSWLLLECVLRPIDIHNVVQWLKTFPEPPLEVIHRWEGYFMKVYQNEVGDNDSNFSWFKQKIEDQNIEYSFDDSFYCVPHLRLI
ncbi:hypothetical protein DFH09DRAFT_1165320 [Mycena vulgaris]|nr:hypothetical protein DFH09DRAFT_1165320 [Mycena vulgaris]